LDAAKGSNLNTGSIKRIKEDLIQDAHRSTDVSLAEAADTYETKRDQYISDSRETRAKAGEELKQLREELKEQERQQHMAPYSLAADLAIGVVGAANPLLGMGLSAMKNKAMS
jgi:F0F1-type ATP synthase assembly protein I